MIYVTNNLDEPRVLFDVTVEHNWTMTKEDEKNLFHSPARGVHAAYIKKYCKVHSKERPFVGLNEKHGYLIEPSSSSYTHQLLPILSPARIDPCFSDILVPSGYYIGSAQRYDAIWLVQKRARSHITKQSCPWREDSMGGPQASFILAWANFWWSCNWHKL